MDYDEYFMRMVYLASSKSKDGRTKIGAILVWDNNVIATGFNGFPRKVKDLKERYDDRQTKIDFITHAEANSVLSAARYGIKTFGSTLYTNGIPCNFCTKCIIQGGVSEIIVHKQWPEFTNSNWVESVKISKIMLEEADIPIRIYDKELGLESLCDGKMIKI